MSLNNLKKIMAKIKSHIKDSHKRLSTNDVLYLFTHVIHVKTGLKGLFTRLWSLLLFNKALDNAYFENNLF